MHESIDFKKISAYRTPDESPGYLLWRISMQWRTTIEKTLKQYNLTHPQFVVLAATAWLTKESPHVSQIDISKSAGLDPNTMSQILRSLETKKFIIRKQKRDERSKNPTLTELGNKILTDALPAVEHADATFFSMLQGNNLNKMVEIFQKILH